MALVAYSDDSDLGSDSEEVEQSPKSVGNNEKKTEAPVESVKVQANVEPKADTKFNGAKGNDDLETGVDSIEDFDEDILTEKRTGLLAAIPSAKPITSSLKGNPVDTEVDELTDVPTVDTWKVTQQIKQDSNEPETSKLPSKSGFTKKEKRKVKFIVPSLAEFAEEEEEEEEKEVPERKKMKPSSTGTGLFAILPQPKNLAVKETKRSLVPHILTKRPTPPVKKPRKVPSRVKPAIEGNDSDEEGETAGTSDFFSLSEPIPNPTIPSSVGSVSSAPDVQPVNQPIPKERVEEPTVSTQVYTNNIPYYEQNEEQEVYPQYGPEDSSGQAVDIDQEAMLRLTGKRRGKGEAINFIDVSADDALLTRDEWMTKALTEEKPSQSFSKKKEGLPSQRTKQKHQITYLAHQAKERELELKNNWAQNRMTKMQTQAKYGF